MAEHRTRRRARHARAGRHVLDPVVRDAGRGEDDADPRGGGAARSIAVAVLTATDGRARDVGHCDVIHRMIGVGEVLLHVDSSGRRRSLAHPAVALHLGAAAGEGRLRDAHREVQVAVPERAAAEERGLAVRQGRHVPAVLGPGVARLRNPAGAAGVRPRLTRVPRGRGVRAVGIGRRGPGVGQARVDRRGAAVDHDVVRRVVRLVGRGAAPRGEGAHEEDADERERERDQGAAIESETGRGHGDLLHVPLSQGTGFG